MIDDNRRSERLRFAYEKYAQAFADRWRGELWSVYFKHSDPVHNGPNTPQANG